MKITQIAFIALLSTSTMMAGFTEEIEAGGDAAENITDAVKGQTRAERSTLIAKNDQTNSNTDQSGLVNENLQGSIVVESGTNISDAYIESTNVQRSSNTNQSGLVNKNIQGSVKIGN